MRPEANRLPSLDSDRDSGGIAMRRWLYWFTFPWGAAARRAEMLAEANRQQDEERRAAVRRIIDTARDRDGPTWGGPLYRAG